MFFKGFIEDNSTDQKKLFSATKRLLGRENEIEYPKFNDSAVLADKFSDYFVQKIDIIQTKLDNMASTAPPPPPPHIASENVSDVPSISQFTLLSESDVQKLIEATPKKLCMLDPIPTPLVIGCINILLPVITKIINISLQTGQFTDQWKCALVHPLLKKPGLDLVLKNYRPGSNLQYISKLTEKAVFQQTNGHMVINS